MTDPNTTDNHDLPLIAPIGEDGAENYEDEWGHILNEGEYSDGTDAGTPGLLPPIEEQLIIRDVDDNLSDYTAHEDAIFWASDTGAVYLGDGNSWSKRNAEFETIEAENVPETTVSDEQPPIGDHGDIWTKSIDGGDENWKHNTETYGVESGVVQDDDFIYYGTWEPSLVKASKEDGSEEWRFQASGTVTTSGLAKDEDTIYFGTNGDVAYAVDTSGNEKWSEDIGAEIYSGFEVDNGTVFFGDNAGVLHALDTSDGSEEWNFDLGDTEIRSDIIVDEDHVYLGTEDGFAYAIPPGGDLSPEWEFDADGNIRSGFAQDDDNVYFHTSTGDNLYSIDKLFGNENWSTTIGGGQGDVVFDDEDDNILYSGSFDGVHALDVDNHGSTVWEWTEFGTIRTDIAQDDENVYVATDDGLDDQFAYALSKEDGSEVWETGIEDSSESGMVIDDGIIYFGDSDGFVYGLFTQDVRDIFFANGEEWVANDTTGLGSEDEIDESELDHDELSNRNHEGDTIRPQQIEQLTDIQSDDGSDLNIRSNTSPLDDESGSNDSIIMNVPNYMPTFTQYVPILELQPQGYFPQIHFEGALKNHAGQYAETVHSMGLVSGTTEVQLVDNSEDSDDGGNLIECTLEGDTTFEFKDASSDPEGNSFTMKIGQDDTGGHNITWPSEVMWDGGEAPLLPDGKGVVNIVSFVSWDGGDSWVGFEGPLIIPPLYNEGEGEDDWIEGYSQEGNESTATKEDDHLFLRAEAGGVYTAEAAWVTDDTYDLSAYSSVEIEWENTGDDHTDNNSWLIVSDEQMENYDVFEERLGESGPFSRQTDSLDISDLSGEYYIRFHSSSLETEIVSEIRGFRVGLVE